VFAWCVRLSRLLVGFQTHFKSMKFHSFTHAIITEDRELMDTDRQTDGQREMDSLNKHK